MSKKSAQASRSERASAAVREQQRQEARRRNTMYGVVAGVLIVVLVGGFLWMRANDSSDDVQAPAAGSDHGLTIGESDQHEVIVYEDFHCVHCADLEAASNEELAQFAEEGSATVEYRPVAFLTDYSQRAANAFKVVLDAAGADVAKQYHDLLFEHYDEASESQDGLDDDTLVELAVEAGATEADVRPGIEEMAQQDWVDEATKAAQDAGVQGTPTVLLDGEPVSGGAEDIADSLAEAIG